MNKDHELSAMRQDYRRDHLDDDSCPDLPSPLFAQWFQDAREGGVLEPNAMTLATVSPEGRPSARIVLLKGQEADDYTFFSNYESRKGQDIDANPQVALLFFWDRLERQVRIEGKIARATRAVTEAYFKSRPRDSQIGAIVSRQSRDLPDRRALEDAFTDMAAAHDAPSALKAPDHWGGYTISATRYEFWQGRANRLHDRICYLRSSAGAWHRNRLYP